MKSYTDLRWLIVEAKQGRKAELSGDERAALFHLLANGLRRNNRDRLQRRLLAPLSLWPTFGILERVVIRNEKGKSDVHYIAGQSYPYEIREVRKCLLD